MATTTKCQFCNTDSNHPYVCDNCGEIIDDSPAWWDHNKTNDYEDKKYDDSPDWWWNDDLVGKDPDDIEDWNNDYLTDWMNDFNSNEVSE